MKTLFKMFPVALVVAGAVAFGLSKPERDVIVFVDAAPITVAAKATPGAARAAEQAILTHAAAKVGAPFIVDAAPIVVTSTPSSLPVVYYEAQPITVTAPDVTHVACADPTHKGC